MDTLVTTRPDTDTPGLGGPPRTPARAVSWRFITLATVGAFALITAVNVSVRVFHDFYVTVYRSSAHVITPTLIASGVFFVATMIGLIGAGRLRWWDLGWQRSKIAPALALTAGIWSAFQLVELAAAVVSGTGPRLSPDVTAAGWATAVGVLLGVALGVAPGEETFFRGFLLPQLQMRSARRSAAGAVAVAIVASQLLFALYHLPNLALGNSGHVGTTPADITVQLGLDFMIGVVFAGLYLRTGNLFLVIGIHALQDAGTSLVATPIDPGLVIFTLAVVLLLATFAPGVRSRIRALGSVTGSFDPAGGAPPEGP